MTTLFRQKHPLVRQFLCVLTGAALLLAAACATAQPAGSDNGKASEDSKKFSIQKVKGDLYRFTAEHHHSVFLVTEKGIVVTDPISEEAATWLKAELATRFDVPVRYVIYSHSHPDHTYGGKVFADDGIVFIAHQMAGEQLKRTKADTRLPDVTFADELLVSLGQHTVQLRYHGPNNGKGSISMYFEQQRALFVVDWVVLGRMPYMDLPGYDLAGMIASTEEVLQMDFDIFVGGHADIGDKEGVRRYLGYLNALHDGVLDGMRAGKSLEDIKAELTLEEFSDLAQYEAWREMNIEGAYRMLRDDAYMLRRPDVPSPE